MSHKIVKNPKKSTKSTKFDSTLFVIRLNFHKLFLASYLLSRLLLYVLFFPFRVLYKVIILNSLVFQQKKNLLQFHWPSLLFKFRFRLLSFFLFLFSQFNAEYFKRFAYFSSSLFIQKNSLNWHQTSVWWKFKCLKKWNW